MGRGVDILSLFPGPIGKGKVQVPPLRGDLPGLVGAHLAPVDREEPMPLVNYAAGCVVAGLYEGKFLAKISDAGG